VRCCCSATSIVQCSRVRPHKSDHQPTDQSQIRSPAHGPITNQITSPRTNHKSDHQPTNQSQIRSPAHGPIKNQIPSPPTNHESDNHQHTSGSGAAGLSGVRRLGAIPPPPADLLLLRLPPSSGIGGGHRAVSV
jgi:hypothetical protein